jgi:hypothetical protein
MSDTARKSPAPSATATFAELESELSEVRTRPSLARRPSTSSSSMPAVQSERRDSVGAAAFERSDRIERKLRIAQALLADLPPSDGRARLLRAAIVRRDEALLDGILYDR